MKWLNVIIAKKAYLEAVQLKSKQLSLLEQLFFNNKVLDKR